MYARGTHRLITTDGCLVENETANKIVQVIRAIMGKYHMEPYNEDTGEGFMRHVVVRVGHTSNEVLVTLVTNKDEFKGAKNFCRELVARVPKITTIVQNVNTRQTNVILGDGIERTLYGPGFILDSLCGVSFRISSHSFYQVNAIQTEVLYERALEMHTLHQVTPLLMHIVARAQLALRPPPILSVKRLIPKSTLKLTQIFKQQAKRVSLALIQWYRLFMMHEKMLLTTASLQQSLSVLMQEIICVILLNTTNQLMWSLWILPALDQARNFLKRSSRYSQSGLSIFHATLRHSSATLARFVTLAI